MRMETESPWQYSEELKNSQVLPGVSLEEFQELTYNIEEGEYFIHNGKAYIKYQAAPYYIKDGFAPSYKYVEVSEYYKAMVKDFEKIKESHDRLIKLLREDIERGFWNYISLAFKSLFYKVKSIFSRNN